MNITALENLDILKNILDWTSLLKSNLKNIYYDIKVSEDIYESQRLNHHSDELVNSYNPDMSVVSSVTELFECEVALSVIICDEVDLPPNETIVGFVRTDQYPALILKATFHSTGRAGLRLLSEGVGHGSAEGYLCDDIAEFLEKKRRCLCKCS